MMYNLRHAWSWLRHRPLGAALAGMSAVLGAALLVLLWHVELQSRRTIEDNLLGVDLIVGAKGSPLQLVLSTIYQNDAPTGNIPWSASKPYLSGRHPVVADAVPMSIGDSYSGYRIVGTQPKLIDWYGAKISEGRIWAAPMEVVLGAEIAKAKKMKVGDTFTSNHGFLAEQDLTHEHAPYKVVGILAPSGKVADRLIVTSLESYWVAHDTPMHAEAHAHESEGAPAHEHEPGHAHEGEEAVKEPAITALLCKYKNHGALSLNLPNLINQNTDWQAASPALEMNRLYLLLGQGTEALAWIGRILVFVSALSLLMSLWLRLQTRQSELALLRTLGAGPGRLFGLIVLEGCLMALPAVFFGFVFGHLSLWLLNATGVLGAALPLKPWVLHPNEVWLLPAALILGCVSALWPAVRAYRTSILTLLNSN